MDASFNLLSYYAVVAFPHQHVLLFVILPYAYVVIAIRIDGTFIHCEIYLHFLLLSD